MNNGKIALQLMTLREVTSFGAKGLLQIREIKDKKIYGVDDAFRMVKELGISYLELSKISVTDELAEEMAAACRAYDMHIIAPGIIYERYMPDEPGDLLSTDFDRIVRRCKQFDAHYVRNGMLPRSCFSSYDGYMRAAEGFNEYGRRLFEHGIKLYLHTHHYEFQRFGNKFGLELLIENTDPRYVGFELDTHWVQRGGQNPAKWIRRLAGRVDLLHLKDYRIQLPPEPEMSRSTLQKCIEYGEIGEGNLDWDEIFAAAQEAGVRYYPIEQDDTYGRNPFESIANSVHNLREMGYGGLF